ncbi:SDR family oxidoreductase [Fluviibacterium sp. DFM31]|uniref:SDR family oxidoreductase n=1 Tax=Meridianimarinicoccus marinus TaxID=3231483 RepID=A0ABV3L6Z2_9RHOB
MTGTILITGAGRGIGKACATAFLNAGWKVGLVGRTAATLEDAAAGHEAALVLACDVTDEDAVAASFARAHQHWGHLDALFNNAGVSLIGTSFEDLSVADFRRLIDINLTGSFICAHAAFRLMKDQSPQGGRIINNGSISAHVPRWGSAPYTCSKHAITGLTRSISLDGRPHNIACGQIDIGNARTEMIAPRAGALKQADGHPKAEPLMDVDNVARSVLHMASLPLDANVQFMTVMATTMPYIGRG